MQTSEHSALVGMLIAARQDRQPLEIPSDDALPATVAEAYAIQDRIVTRLGGHSAWKVGPTGVGGDEPRCAALLRRDFSMSPADLSGAPFVSRPLVEAEIAVRFSRDIPAGAAPVDADTVIGAIGSVHCALEVLSSRFRDRRAMPALLSLADLQNNAAVVLGDGIENWQSLEFADVAFELNFDGGETLRGPGGPSTAEVIDTLVWLANHAAGRGLAIRAGHVVITGARTPATELPGHVRKVTAQASGIGAVSAIF
ncbi:2-keto-4-pentenoate hydratase [Radicibacter daui]|uniref:2-keto-4-pentenoate hydratase n=1 Tax=Radicibacter daui TaxID=3064829 RepID=UPI004046AB4C